MWCLGCVLVWVVGEYIIVCCFCEYFCEECGVDFDDFYVSCYWKIGVGDEGMKVVKKVDFGVW